MSHTGQQRGQASYSTCLDALGLSLERAGATQVFINEIEGGFLLGYSAGGQQQVSTMDADALARLLAQASQGPGLAFSTHIAPAFRGRRRGTSRDLRGRLRAVGAHLDQRCAQAIVVLARAAGFCMEYTAIPPTDVLNQLARISETLEV